MQRPRLRAIRGFPAMMGQQQVLGLADARQISDKVVYTSPAAQHLLPMMDGSKTLDEMVAAIGRGLTRPILEGLVAQLDDAGLLQGPTFDGILSKMRADFDSAPVLPPGTTAAIAEALATQEFEGAPAATTDEEREAFGVARLKTLFDQWVAEGLKEVTNPSLDALPKAVVAPHLDYPRGWINYAHTYGRLRVVDRPDRVIILGTNHFGEGTGVVGCDKGYQTPLGTCEVDQAVVDGLKKNLGAENATKLFANRFDHEREHSIELQIPWIQHAFGVGPDGKYPKVFAALVHDPSANNGESYDGNGLALDPFVEAMKATLAALPGRTLVISSADLSHVGPSFGDQVAMAGEEPQTVEFRNGIFRHDREMLGLLEQGKPDELVASMSWQQNPSRWCSLGNLVAAMRITGSQKLTIFSYAGAMDPQGQALVSSVSGMME